MGTPRDKPAKKPKPLRRVSKKRAAVNRKRRDFVREVLTAHPICQAYEVALKTTHGGATGTLYNFLQHVLCVGNPSVEVHEPATRARFPGSDTILNKANAVAVCANCHRRIHANPALSEACGLLVPSHG